MELLLNAAHCPVRGGMMIECMSTVILTGCGPEVCATSNNTKRRLRRQTEVDGGHRRRGGGRDMETVWGKRERETDRGKCMERVINPLILHGGLVLELTMVTIPQQDGWGIPVQTLFPHSFCLSSHTQSVLR